MTTDLLGPLASAQPRSRDRKFESVYLQRGVNCSLHYGAASLFIEQELSPKRVQALLLSLRADKGLYRSVVQIWDNRDADRE